MEATTRRSDVPAIARAYKTARIYQDGSAQDEWMVD